MNIMDKTFLFFELLLNAAFIFIPVLLVLSWWERRMFKPSAAMVFFVLSAGFFFAWRFVYVISEPLDFIVLRYMAPLLIFMIIAAVPGIYTLAGLIHRHTAAKWPSFSRGRIIAVIMIAVAIVSLGKEFRRETEKVFLRELGMEVRKITEERKLTNFVIYENVGESNRLTYYSPSLSGHLYPIPKESRPTFNRLFYFIKESLKKPTIPFVFTRDKSPEEFQRRFELENAEYHWGKFPFRIIKVYQYRKHSYLLLEFDPNGFAFSP